MTELDLHGLKMADALSRFVGAYNELVGRPRACIKVIHGYGSTGSGGEIRSAIRKMLQQNSHCCDVVKGEVCDGNPGYTLVYPKKRLPSGVERLWDSVVEFCEIPRTQQEILSRFIRRSSEPEVNQAIRELEVRGRLRGVWKNGRKQYVAG